MRVVVGGSAFMGVGSFGEGVVIVFAEVGTELVFGEISEVLVPPFEVLLRLVQVELFAHSNVIICCSIQYEHNNTRHHEINLI